MIKLNKPLRLGFLGGGINSAIGTSHFIAAQMDSHFRVEAGCFSRDANINTQSAEQWGIEKGRCYATWQEMLVKELGRLDAIAVLTPTPDHLQVVIGAIKAGYVVICEKALAASSKDAAEIEKAVRDSGGFLAVTYNYTGYPMVRELREMIRNGHFGRIEQIHVEMPQEGFARLNDLGQPMTPQQWRLRDGVIPTISLDLGVHVLQMVDFLTDVRPLQVVATQSSMGRFQDIVDNTMVLVRYSKNVEGTLWFSKAALGHRNGLRVRVYGADGAAEWFQMEPETLLLSDSQGRRTLFDRASVNATVSRQPRYNRFKSGHPAGFLEAFANLYVDIANAITRTGDVPTTSSEFLFTARKAWEGLHVLEAIDMSARKHCWVDINWE